MSNLIPGTVIITGSGKGIGRIIALKLAEINELDLILISRSLDSLEKTATECKKISGKSVPFFKCDISKANDVKKLSVNIPNNPITLINNAGSYLGKLIQDTTPNDLQQQLDSNLFGAFNITNHFLPVMKKADRGLIVTIGSIASVSGLKRGGAYAASKHAVLGWSRSLRHELMDTNIAVSAINIGPTWSSSWDGSDTNPDRIINPEDIASLILTLMNLSQRSVVEELLLMPHKGDL